MDLLAETAGGLLSAWQNFYVIIGSSAGALIGLQFVVITLIAGTRHRAEGESIAAFGTPTVVHFGEALTLSALMSAPWPSRVAVAVVLGLCGLGGLAYTAIVFRRANRQTTYKPVPEDWLWHVILPGCVYGLLVISACLLPWLPRLSLFLVAASVLALLLIGVRNAWDTVTYIVTDSSHDRSVHDAGETKAM